MVFGIAHICLPACLPACCWKEEIFPTEINLGKKKKKG
jgi:hypothetical protein